AETIRCRQLHRAPREVVASRASLPRFDDSFLSAGEKLRNLRKSAYFRVFFAVRGADFPAIRARPTKGFCAPALCLSLARPAPVTDNVPMELHQVRYCVALCKNLNFTRAAEACNVTQPALTRAIQKLEDELGGPLFERERNLTQLTELGRLMR